MSYRIGQKPKPKPRRTIQKLTTPADKYIDNGSTSSIAFPCFYVPIESAEKIDTQEALDILEKHNINQTTNKNIKQIHDSSRDIPIHLKKEYPAATVEVSFDSMLEGLSVLDSYIDEEPNDYIVRIVFKAECKSAQKKEQTCAFTIRIIHGNMKDILFKGTLHVLPAIL